MNLITAVIIDDESLARELVKKFLLDYPFITIVQECSDGFQGIKSIQETKPDLVFLDVQMPKLNGFEVLELLENPPIILFTTAFNEYAIKAFELNAIDYLLKPFSRERFGQAIEKVKSKLISKESEVQKLKTVSSISLSSDKLERIVVKTGTKIEVISLASILYLEAQDDYVMVFTNEGKYLKQQTMKYYESRLDNALFVRIHRSYIVNILEIVRLEPYEKDSIRAVLKNSKTLPVSKTGYGILKKLLSF